MSSAGAWSVRPDPRRWQVEALEAWRREHRGIAKVVTGAGKTVFAEMCLAAVTRDLGHTRAIIVVPSIALLDQWYVSLLEELGVSEAEVATYSGDGWADRPTDLNLVLLNTARRAVRQLADGAVSCLVVDECHRAASPMNSLALAGSHSATLGLSATPERQYDEGFLEHLIPALGPVIYEYDYSAARRDGVIVPFRLVNVAVELLPLEQERYSALTRRVSQLREAREAAAAVRRVLIARASVSATASMRIPVAVSLAQAHRAARVIVFHERVAAAESIARMLRTRGVSTVTYHTGIAAPARRENLRLFRRGDFDVLVTCRALDEGLSVPEVGVAIIASSTASVRQRIQRMGRVLRPSPGKSTAVIFTLYATTNEEERLADEAGKLADVSSVEWQRAGLGR